MPQNARKRLDRRVRAFFCHPTWCRIRLWTLLRIRIPAYWHQPRGRLAGVRTSATYSSSNAVPPKKLSSMTAPTIPPRRGPTFMSVQSGRGWSAICWALRRDSQEHRHATYARLLSTSRSMSAQSDVSVLGDGTASYDITVGCLPVHLPGIEHAQWPRNPH